MPLAYKKIDGGKYWIYRSRFKTWHLLLIAVVPILSGYLWLPMISYRAAVISVLFGIGFAFVYGITSLPAQWAFRRATKESKRIITEKKEGYFQYLVPKNK